MKDDECAKELQKITEIWESGANLLMCEYYMDKNAPVGEQYQQFLINENLVGRLDEVYQTCKSAAKKLPDTDQSFVRIYEDQIPCNVKPEKIDFRICTLCNGKMTIYPHTSEMRCSTKECGNRIELKGTVFEDTHFYGGGSDGQLSVPKRGRHETNKHCSFHLDRILALKSIIIPKTLDDAMDKWISNNGIRNLKNMTCATFRRCFKETKQTKFNEHVPYIRQYKTGVIPEGLLESERKLVFIYFDKTVQAVNAFDGVGGGNMKYYPYFLLKILEIILRHPKNARRLQSIIDCIHFQHDETISQNDKLWERVCAQVPEFSGLFKKTNSQMLQMS